MELKVWVEGIQRVVCGVCDRTTCQDVVYALAHATGKTGRFTLIERWRNNERLLAPHEHPLKVLMKWGEYSSDVHFILQRTALDSSGGINNNKNNVSPSSIVSPANNKSVSSRPTKTSVDPLHGFTPPGSSSPSNKADLKKSLTFSGGRPAPSDSPQSRDNGERRLNVGVVRGIPQQHPYQTEVDEGDEIIAPFTPPRQNGLEKLSFHSPSVPPPYHQQQHSPANDTGHLVYPRYEPPYGRIVNNGGGAVEPSPPPPSHPAQYSSPRDTTTLGEQKQDSSIRFPPPYRDPPQPFISPAGASNRQPPPPPYREPPRPSRASGLSPAGYRSSPAPSPNRIGSSSNNSTPVRPVRSAAVEDDPTPGAASDVDVPAQRRSSRRNLKLDLNNSGNNVGNGRAPSPPPSDPVNAQLIQKVNRQRGNLDEQQDRLGHIEQELAVWEDRLQRRLEEERQRLTKEWVQLEERCRQQDHQLSDLRDVEEEWERACREGREMTEELGRWRADVSSIEARIEQCGPTLRALRIDVTAAEERLTSELESEMARVKAELEAAAREERAIDEEAERADEDVAESEERLQGIRSEMDHLTQEIKQANLQSLSIAPADDLKVLLEGSYKSGHSRRMLGSPRQLENPVPTNKNPHGVWV